VLERRVGPDITGLVTRIRRIEQLMGQGLLSEQGAAQPEAIRRMLLAMAADIRVVVLLLARQLALLRDAAARKRTPTPWVSDVTLRVLAPLANRLGLGQLKWELEDLAFRFTQPEVYKGLARQLESRRVEREAFIAQAIAAITQALAAQGIDAQVFGRPKHLYSIHQKMQAKSRSLEGIQDLRALRVIVNSVAHCYAALDVVHGRWKAVTSEFDDYIARPKSNGYRSLHTVVIAEDGLPLEVQIRTEDMHRFAEYGVASHWRYKEGARAGVSPGSAHDQALTWLRQLLAWQGELRGGQAGLSEYGAADGAPVASAGASAAGAADGAAAPDDYIYVLTPQARIIELPRGATPVDFAYHVHSDLGHRCRGAKVDGQMVPLNRPLQTGQTVEVITAKEGAGVGPSRDWLNPQLGYLASAKARNKVRQWFNPVQAPSGTEPEAEPPVAAAAAPAPTDVVLEQLLRPGSTGGGRRQARPGLLVVGVDALLTQLARCCRPVPPDELAGFVTRGRGVSVHRRECATFMRLAQESPERVIATAWDTDVLAGKAPRAGAPESRYAVDVEVLAQDRPALLRDVSEMMARDRINVTAVNTQSRQQQAMMRFTVEVTGGDQLQRLLQALRGVTGVLSARRR
jgi:GTP pyrophosphokinase